jgi:hypothetical protein
MSLSQPSRTIVVEPVEAPATAPAPAEPPAREPLEPVEKTAEPEETATRP